MALGRRSLKTTSISVLHLDSTAVPKPKRHSNAMKERERKDFHFEFTTLRFKPISEFGTWKGQKNFIPTLGKDNS